MGSRSVRTLAAHAVLPALVTLLLLPRAGAAVDAQLLAGKRLTLRQSARTERLSIVSRDRLVAPLPGGTDDPTLTGAVLDLGNPATGEWARFLVPAAGWSLNALGTVFRFQAPQRSPGAVRALVIRHGKRLKVSGTAVGLTLDERAQGALAVVLTSGTRRYCLLFGGGSVRRDVPRRFAARNAVAPAMCTLPPAGGEPPSTTTTIRTSPSTTTSRPAPTTTSTSTSSSTSTTAPAPTPTTTTTTTSSSTSSTRVPTTSTSTSTSTSSSASTSSTSTSTSSTTSTTGYTCGGFGIFCGGTCPPSLRCVGGVITPCRCEFVGGRDDD
jgi:hypothetical protein